MFENTLWLGDCFDVMAMLPDQSIDMILADLPYGTTKCKWDTVLPFDLLWEQYKRVIKPGKAIVLTGSQPFTSALVMSNPAMFKYEWIWEKSKASNFLLAKKQPLKAHENVLVFANGSPCYYPQKTQGEPYYRGGINQKHDNPEVSNNIPNYHNHIRKSEDGMRFPRSVQYFKTAEFEGKFHPTQKPVALFSYLIKTYSQENEIVLDNVAGGFTTAISAIETGRQYICIEKDEKYYNLGYQRVQEYQHSLVG